ncbi:MAG TPA: N-acetyltransferase, partial [candidate division Zixibacteria bacterium]|nr:N-acetyltransferase [candidate division Zixibacteria bacterium]
MIGEKDCWGQGYATEAIGGLTEYAFNVIGLNRIGAGAYASNIGSYRAFEKAGYHVEGKLLSYWKSDGGYEDEILVGIVRDQH